MLYLGGELVRDENGNLVDNSAVMTGSPTLTFAPAQGTTLATITRSAGNWLFDGFSTGEAFLVSGTPQGKDGGTYTIESIDLTGTVLSVVPFSGSVVPLPNAAGVTVQSLLTYQGGETEIHNAMDPVLDLVSALGQPVAVGTPYSPPVFFAPFSTTLNLSSLIGFSYQLKPGDLVNLVVYQGTAIYDLPISDFTVNTSANTITLNPNADLTGVTEIALSIATQAYHAKGDPEYYYGTEPLQIGQPVVDSTGNLVLTSNDQVELYTAATIGNNATQSFGYTGGTNNSQNFTLNSAPNGYIDVTLAGTDLTSGSEYQVNGTVVTVSPSFVPAQGSQVVITYRVSIMDHQRGEPVYTLSSHGVWVQATYSGGQPAYYFGTEPVLYFGGEQSYYTNEQPLQQAETLHQVLMTGGMPGSILFQGVNDLTIKGGSGNNTFTVVQTQLGTFGTPGTDSTPVTLNTGNGNDQVAIRSIESPVTVQAGTGIDAIDVGSEAGLWPISQNGPPTFENINGFVADISALLSILGGGGNATINVDDTGDPSSVVGALTSTTITGLLMADGIDYWSISTVNINLGPGNDFFTIVSTAHVTLTNLQGGTGEQVLNVQTTAGATTVNPGPGQNTINVGSLAGVNGWNFNGVLAGIQGASRFREANSPASTAW